MRSQPSARLQPAPAATPFTAAMVGFGSSCRASAQRPTVRIPAIALPAPPPCSVFSLGVRSAPEQKPSPAPVSTSTRSSRLSATSVNRSISSRHIGVLIAFNRSGRFSVHVTTPPARSTSSVSNFTGSTPRSTSSTGRLHAPSRPRELSRGPLTVRRSERLLTTCAFAWTPSGTAPLSSPSFLPGRGGGLP